MHGSRPSAASGTGCAVPDPFAPAATDAAADPSLAADARLIRRVRFRLIAWSGLSTRIVLLVLGVAMYAIVARQLEAAGTAQLEARHSEIEHELQSGRPGPSLGQIFGGRASGTIALLVLVVVWSLLGMTVAQTPWLANSGLLQAIFYVVAGIGWVLPAMPIVSWMSRPDV